MDLFSRKIVGWAMASNMPAELVCSAMQMAIAHPVGLIVHSDRDCQYASDAYRALLARHGLRASMSRKANCWVNAVMERVWQRDCANRGESIRDITDYIVSPHNSVRLHSKLGYLPPTTYEHIVAAKQPINVFEIACPL